MLHHASMQPWLNGGTLGLNQSEGGHMGQLIIVDYDPEWPRLFESLKASLLPVLAGVATSIEHVGSTAVPGLASSANMDLLKTAWNKSNRPTVGRRPKEVPLSVEPCRR
jgi:GrpB-like predicted nucleotidyltransferase (UPF0157 family)